MTIKRLEGLLTEYDSDSRIYCKDNWGKWFELQQIAVEEITVIDTKDIIKGDN